MRAFARLISRCLLLVMLLTVFSPSFGREALSAAGLAEDATTAMQSHASMAAAEADCDGCPGHEHGAPSGATHAEHDHAALGEADHHCCPGHMLGHLPGLALDLKFLLPSSGSAAIDGPASRFSSRIPDGLERPPRTAA